VVGITLDDVPFGSSTALGYGSRLVPDLDPSDLARIEVLRGPQGTLYGASSIGGLLKFVTTDPSTDNVSGRIQADGTVVGKGEIGFGARGAVNLPIGPNMAIRVSGFGRREPGYVDNLTTGKDDVNRSNVYGGRASALWKPTEDVSLKLGALYQKTRGFGTAEVDADVNLRPVVGDLSQTRLPGTGRYTLEAQLYSGTLAVALAPDVDLTSVTAYGITHYRGLLDTTETFGGLSNLIFGVQGASLLNDFKTKKFSQEVRLAATMGVFDLLVGGFYTHEKTPARQAIIANDLATGASSGLLLDSLFPTTFKEYAAFGDLTVHLGDRFDIQLGGRYSKNKQSYHEMDSGPLITADITASSKDDVFTYLITPRFRVSPDLMIYGRVASGYRAGGPNPGATLGFPSQYFADETVNYEVGVKGSLLDRALTFDASLYYVDWTDIQITLRDPGTGFAYFTNAGKAKSQGAEVSLEYRTNGLSVAANASINDAKLTSNPPANAGAARKGDRLPLSSRFSASLSIDQDVELSNDWTAFIGGTLSYVGRRAGNFVQFTTDTRLRYPAYAAVDLRAGVRGEDWTYTLFIQNMGDRRGIIGGDPRTLGGTSQPGDPFYVNYIRPRTVGLSIAKTF
jgi:outer membrane receptor protein involved in Fe transport